MESFVADAIFIDAAPERVIEALLAPEDVLVWLDGEEVSVAAAVGGPFTVHRSGGARIEGTISRLEAHLVEIRDLEHSRGEERCGPTRLTFEIEPRDGGVWLVARHADLDTAGGWEGRARDARRELVAATVALKRHIEGI